MMHRNLANRSLSAFAGATLLMLSVGQASAFTLASPSLDQPFASSHLEKVWWDRWGNWHPNAPRWGWNPGWGSSYGDGYDYGQSYGYDQKRWCYWHPRACGVETEEPDESD